MNVAVLTHCGKDEMENNREIPSACEGTLGERSKTKLGFISVISDVLNIGPKVKGENTYLRRLAVT